MEARDSKKNNQAKASKRPFQTNKGTFRVCHLWWVLTCKIPQAATAWVWDALGLHVQILTYPEETSDYTLHSEQRIFWGPFSPLPAAATWTNFLLATASGITFTTGCTIILNIWSSKRTHVSKWGITEAFHLSASKRRALILGLELGFEKPAVREF